MGRFDYDPLAALNNAPKIMGMELRANGQNKLCGGYYLNGDKHQFRGDKIKVFISRGSVWVAEEGGRCISLPQWLIEFGQCANYKEALKVIKGESQALDWNRDAIRIKRVPLKYVSVDVLNGAKAFDLALSPLFRHMCRLFPEERVRKVWNAYNVTSTCKGGTCFWYLNRDGKICHDKVVWYDESGHRIKTLPMNRKFRIAEGYTENPLFGCHLKKKPRGILESEKSALYASCYYGGVWLATGGKGNLRDSGGVPLYPDRDAEETWSSKGDCVDWYSDWKECGDHSDLGDKIEWLILNNSK